MPGEFAGGFFEEFVDEGLAGFGLLDGHAAGSRSSEMCRTGACGFGRYVPVPSAHACLMELKGEAVCK